MNTELDEAEIRLEFRRQYKELGFTVMLRVLSELLIASRICSEIIVEERLNEKEKS